MGSPRLCHGPQDGWRLGGGPRPLSQLRLLGGQAAAVRRWRLEVPARSDIPSYWVMLRTSRRMPSAFESDNRQGAGCQRIEMQGIDYPAVLKGPCHLGRLTNLVSVHISNLRATPPKPSIFIIVFLNNHKACDTISFHHLTQN